MAKSKEKKKLVGFNQVPTAKVFQDVVKERKDKVAKAKAVSTKNGKLDKYNPKYRQALKRLKRSQRALHKQRIRFTRPGVPIEAPAAAAAPTAAPAAAPAAAEGEKK